MAKSNEQPQGPAYMQLFAVLMLLLLAFFVILCTFAEQRNEGFQDDIGKVREGFGLTGGMSFLPYPLGELMPKRSRHPRVPSKKGAQRDALHEKQISSRTGGPYSTSKQDTKANQEPHYVRLPIPHPFNEGEYQLTDLQTDYLNGMGPALSSLMDNYFTIRAYCDESDDETADKRLAMRRAASVMRYFHREHGISYQRMSAAGYTRARYFRAEGKVGSVKNANQLLYLYCLAK